MSVGIYCSYSESVTNSSDRPNGLLSPNSIKSLKFSIENILSPEFGRTTSGKPTSITATTPSINNISPPPSSIFIHRHNHHRSAPISSSSSSRKSENITNGKSISSKGLPINGRGESGSLIRHHNGHRDDNDDDRDNVASKPKKARCSFDISSLTGKRKHSSDSESSTTSTFSSNSKDSLSQQQHHHHQQHKQQQQQKVTTTTTNSNSVNKDPSVKESKGTTDDKDDKTKLPMYPWPAWVYCTRYSDRPSSGPRSRRSKKKDKKPDEKRPRTAFTAEQLARLKQEFQENRYLTEKRRQDLARDLKLNESQIKIWFQNKRAKIKKANGQRNPLALHLMAQGLYNHSTVNMRDDDDDDYMDDESDSGRRSTSSCSEPATGAKSS